jgi:hypothetical protein
MRLLTWKTLKSRVYVKNALFKRTEKWYSKKELLIFRDDTSKVFYERGKLNYAVGTGFNCPTGARFLSLPDSCSESRLDMHGVLLVSMDV